ncbi:MAG: hypothetical protein NT121_14160 [Chloroflexi bacterium]|nr:hypothetical protein [Chloroflexota bacterium]
MAKKSRSTSTKSTPSKSTPTFAGIQRGVVGTEFNPDYSTTKHELKRIGILAASFFALLIALSFFIK